MSDLSDLSVHATCVLVAECGVLLRGPAGSGKSTLARELLDRGPGRLVGDDRIRLRCRSGRLLAFGHPAIAGLLEIRGVGPVPAPRAVSAVVRLVIDLDPDAPRVPGRASVDLLEVALPRIALPEGQDRAGAALWRIRTIRDMMMAG